MMFGKRLTAVGFGLAAGLLISSNANAQNENNWHALTNDFDGIFLASAGGGAGPTATANKDDGVGTWLPGEDLRGSTLATFSSDFGFKLIDIEHIACFFMPGGGAGPGQWQPDFLWFEYDGRNSMNPDVFTNPTCTGAGLIAGTGGIGAPLGDPPATSASLIVAGLPTFIGTGSFVGPNNGLVPTSQGGTLTYIGGFFLASSDGSTFGVPTGCFSFDLGLVPTSVVSEDDIDGWWHWRRHGDSPVSNNYVGYTFTEQTVNMSHSMFTGSSIGNSATGFVQLLPAVFDYNYSHTSMEASLSAAMSPSAPTVGTYYTNTAVTNNTFGGTIDINMGYDVGRGSSTLSLAGATGYADVNDLPGPAGVLAAQDPAGGNAGGGSSLASIGLHGWDTRDYDGDGVANGVRTRVAWMGVNNEQFFKLGSDAGTQLDIVPSAGVRVPIATNAGTLFPGFDFPSSLTLTLLLLFTHDAIPTAGFPDPQGFPAGATGKHHIAGTSQHFPSGSASGGRCFGATGPFAPTALSLSLGTSGLNAGGDLDWNPAVASASGRKTMFVFD